MVVTINILVPTMGSVIDPTDYTISLENPLRGVGKGYNLSWSIPFLEKASQKWMSAELPLSTSIFPVI